MRHPILTQELTISTVYGIITARGEGDIPSVDKIIEKMKRQPNGISMSEADKVLSANGYSFARQKGSHRHYINQDGDVITIKDDKPLKAVYVKDILSRI